MYVWIWRTLPGGPVGKVIGSVLLALAVVTVLFLWVFPWVEDNFALLSDVTIEEDAAAVDTVTDPVPDHAPDARSGSAA